jgi:hypothetical protein
MLRLKHCAEWLYYGFWYLVAWYTLDLPRLVIYGDSGLRQPFLWIVQHGWTFPYLLTMDERKELSLGQCCYGGHKTKEACASCAAWRAPNVQGKGRE